MSTGIFKTIEPIISENSKIRSPQREVFSKLVEAAATMEHRELGIVLPVGCGKSGCITLAPFAFKATRALIVAPGVRIASQLHDDFDPTKSACFYRKTGAIAGPAYPEPVEIRGTTTNKGDFNEADVVITNIQQLQGENNRWLNSLPNDYFDLILFDEGHHSVAATWKTLKSHFPSASIVNFSATPLRADGQKMAGEIIYSYPIYRAIQEGYVKRLKALVLNPRTLKYVRREDGKEVDVLLEEVRRLGEEDADFRRSIVTSTETLNTIVDASISELERIRQETEDNRHKIIASALNYQHCLQIVEAYRSRGRKADYVHSREDSKANERVFGQLDRHELDVIVQVRKLGEGFDHPYLSVAAVFSIFANLSPFVQFVGRIMRVISQNNPKSPLNQGTVVFHAGANIARRWEDFQQYSEADQEFFDQLLPVENLDFSSSDEFSIIPTEQIANDSIEVLGQTEVTLKEIPLIKDNPEAIRAIQKLLEQYTPEQIHEEARRLIPVPTTRVLERQAKRTGIDDRVRNETGRILAQRGLNPNGYDLDKKRLKRTNFVVFKTAIDRKINDATGRGNRQRHEFNRVELDMIDQRFPELVEAATNEVFNAAP